MDAVVYARARGALTVATISLRMSFFLMNVTFIAGSLQDHPGGLRLCVHGPHLIRWTKISW